MRKNEGLMTMVVVAIVIFALTSVALSVGAAVESSDFGTTEILKKGFKGNIYYLEKETKELPDFSKMTPVGTIYTEKLDIPPRGFKEGFPGITDRFEWFGISYIGGIVIPSDGNYKFKLTSDDGSKLYIDGELVIVNDGIHPPRTVTKEVYLSKGGHRIGVDYFQGPRAMIALQLFVKTPDGKETPVKPELDPSELEEPTPTPDGEQQRLHPVADGEVYAYSYRNWNWANWGQWPNMGAGWHPTGGEKRAYLRFDVPTGLGISRAVLKLYQTHRWGPVHTLGVYRVTSPWDEGTGTYHSGKVEETAASGELCWEQQPSFDPVPVATFSSATAVPAWVEVDITSLVQQWQGGTPNYGLVVKTTNEHPTASDPVAKSQFCTRESLEQANRPVLELSVGPVSAEPTPAPTPAPTIGKFEECVGDQPYLYVEDKVMGKGKTVEIPIMMCNAKDLANMDLDWSYNAAVLKIIDVTKGSLNKKALFEWNEVSAGKLKISFASSKGVTGSMNSIAVMKFEVIGNPGATSTLTGTVTTASKTDGSKITVGVNPGKFTVGSSPVKGDCDGDGKLTVKDALAALQISVGKMALDMCYDYNGDGKVNSADAREMLKAIVGKK
jgi:uncharacterized protein (DUF2141 family)